MTVDVVTGEMMPAPIRPYRDTFGILDAAIRLADVIADTELVPEVLRGRREAVVAVVLTGHELGLGPMQSLQTIDLIHGRPTLSPEGMRALVLSQGHALIVEANDTAATIKCHRREWASGTWASFTFTIADAERAGLLGKFAWSTYPRAMLTARATGEACRATFADVLAGVSYTAEEIETINVPELVPPLMPPFSLPDDAQEPEEKTRTVPVPEGWPKLEKRLNALAPSRRKEFREWCRAEGVVTPPVTDAALVVIAAEVDAIEARARETSETYG